MQADEARELAQRIVNELNEKCVLTDLEGVHLGFDPDDGYPLVEAILKPLLAHHALEARNEALEEAASFCEGFPNSMTALSLARGIRSLAERASKGAGGVRNGT